MGTPVIPEPITKGKGKSQGPLTLPKAKSAPTPSTTSWEEIQMEEQEERIIMNHRMDQMEHVLNQIVQQLQVMTVQSQSQAAPHHSQTQ